MANVNTYLINFTDPDKNGFSVAPFSSNGTVSPTAIDTAAAQTSITIYGQGSPNYGEKIQENIVHVMEHFSGPGFPQQPINGQIWHFTGVVFRSSTNTFYRYDGSSWVSIPGGTSAGQISNGSSLPPPSFGDVDAYWFDTSTNRLYQLKDFSTPTETIVKNVQLDFIESTSISDPNASNIEPTNELRVYYNNSWNTLSPSGKGTAFVEPTAPTSANLANEGDLWFDFVAGQLYIFENGGWSPLIPSVADFVIKSGDTMTGFLTLASDPTQPLHAATKQYVDTEIAAAITGSTTFTTDDIEDASTFFPGSPLTFTLNSISSTLNNLPSQYLRLDGSNSPMTGPLFLSSNPPFGVVPSAALQAATKGYVDSVVGSGSVVTLDTVTFDEAENRLEFTFSDASVQVIDNVQSGPVGFDSTDTVILSNIDTPVDTVQTAIEELDFSVDLTTASGRLLNIATSYTIQTHPNANILTLTGDQTKFFRDFGSFEIQGSTGAVNDGTYSVEFRGIIYDPSSNETLIRFTPSISNTTPSILGDVVPLSYPAHSYTVGQAKTQVFINGIKQVPSERPQQAVQFTELFRGTTSTFLDKTVAETAINFSQSLIVSDPRPSGLVSPNTYTADVVVNENTTNISIEIVPNATPTSPGQIEEDPSGNVSYAAVISEINNQLTGATASILRGEILLRSDNRGEFLRYAVDSYDTTTNQIIIASTIDFTSAIPSGTTIKIEGDENAGTVTVNGTANWTGTEVEIPVNEPLQITTLLGSIGIRYNIVALTSSSVEVNGDLTSFLTAGRQFRIADSVDNDDFFEVASTTFNSGPQTTTINIVGTLPTTTPTNLGVVIEHNTVQVNDTNLFSSLNNYSAVGPSLVAIDDSDPNLPQPTGFVFNVQDTGATYNQDVEIFGREAATFSQFITTLRTKLSTLGVRVKELGAYIVFYHPFNTTTNNISITDGGASAPPNFQYRMFHFMNEFQQIQATQDGFAGAYEEPGIYGDNADYVTFDTPPTAGNTIEIITTGRG